MSGILRQCEDMRLLWNLLRGRMRARFLSLRGARIGSKATVGRRCVVDRPWSVELGERVLMEADVYLKMDGDAASLKVGDYVFIGRGVEFDTLGDIKVGAHTVIAPRCFITDHNHTITPELRIDQQPCTVEPVAIGADVWLGVGVVVLPGVSIGDGAVVGANSVVTRDVAPMTVVAGAPARFLRMRTDKRRGEGKRQQSPSLRRPA